MRRGLEDLNTDFSRSRASLSRVTREDQRPALVRVGFEDFRLRAPLLMAVLSSTIRAALRLRFESKRRSRERADDPRAAPHTIGNHLRKPRGGLRLATIVALPLVAVERADEVQLPFRLDTLRHDLQPNTVREQNDRAHDRRIGLAGCQISHEASVDLELIDGE